MVIAYLVICYFLSVIVHCWLNRMSLYISLSAENFPPARVPTGVRTGGGAEVRFHAPVDKIYIRKAPDSMQADRSFCNSY